MTKFLLEVYVAALGGDDAEGLGRRVRAAAEALSAEGRPVRCVQTILVPEDETCFFLFEAASAHDVREAADRAGLPLGRTCDAAVDDTGAQCA
jgi:hypothetical protein